MTPEELTLLRDSLQAITEANPNGQNALYTSLIVILAMIAFRVIVVNGLSKKITNFFANTTEGITVLKDIKSTLDDLKQMNKSEQMKLNGVLQHLEGSTRKEKNTDYINPEHLDTQKFKL